MSDTITIVGTVGTDPERKTPNGLPITSFRVASPQRRFDRATGAWIDTGTNWYTVSAYRKLAEHAFESIRKKDRVILTGRLHVRQWDTGERKGTTIEIDVDAIGHDLLFGTSVFTRDDRVSAVAASQPAEGAWTAETDGDAWAPTGTDPSETSASAADAVAASNARAHKPRVTRLRRDGDHNPAAIDRDISDLQLDRPIL